MLLRLCARARRADGIGKSAATFERGAGCYSGCVLAHVEPTALVLFARLDNTRGGVPLCDAGGVFAWFILDTEHRLQEIVTEDFRACL